MRLALVMLPASFSTCRAASNTAPTCLQTASAASPCRLTPFCSAHAGGEHHAHQAAVSRLRTMIASLKEGAAFCKRLTASLKQVQVLLASTQAGVVHDAIFFLTLCK